MRLSTRLKTLEGSQPDAELSRAELVLLVSLLARRDSLFWPWRHQAGSKVPMCEIRLRQREYRDGTQGLRAKASGREQWKQVHFQRQRLIESGLVVANHSGGQVTSLFLTESGEAYARALVGDRLHSCESIPSKVVFQLLKIRHAELGHPVREHLLFGAPCVGDPSDWNDMTEWALPLLTSGVVRCESDTIGRVAYTPIEGVEYPEHVVVAVQSDPDFEDAYYRSFNSERKTLESVEPRDGDECYIPHPATGW